MAGRWIVFGLVMAWRFARAHPIIIVALIALYLVGAGLVALANASGLGAGLYVLIAGAIVVAIVAAGAWRLRPEARATRRATNEEDARLRKNVRDRNTLYVAWELGTISPAEAVAQIQARNPTGRDGASTSQEKGILAEAQDALATGTTAKRDARVKAYRDEWGQSAWPCPIPSSIGITNRWPTRSTCRRSSRATTGRPGAHLFRVPLRRHR